MAALQTYLSLITSEHNQQPKFVAVMGALLQGLVDNQNVVASIPQLYDIDVAVGVQLDVDGQWIGQSRYLTTPLVGVYFSFDTAAVGFDQGTWQGQFDPTSGLVALPDDTYRQLLYAKIGNNQWTGGVPDAYIFLNKVFPGNTTLIQDNQDMSMILGVVGPVPLNAVTTSLLENGYLDVKPVGVRISAYALASVVGAPVFGFDVNNSTIGGFNSGAWATLFGGR